MKAIFRSINNVISANLYVEGYRTEIWYFLPEYKFYNINREMNIEQFNFAHTVQKLINAGAINVDNWESWDICTTCPFKVSHLKILIDDEIFNSNNVIISCTGHQDYSDFHIQNLIIQQYIGITETVQWKHRIVGNKLSNTLAIKFFRYGFQLGFFKDDTDVSLQSQTHINNGSFNNFQESNG